MDKSQRQDITLSNKNSPGPGQYKFYDKINEQRGFSFTK